MKKDGRRGGLWVAAIIAVAGVAATLRPWWYPTADPVTRAKRAYEQRGWQRAADALRGPLKTGPGTGADPEALRIYARSLVRLERDEAANAIYGRLGAAPLEPEDQFLVGLMLVRAGKPEPALEVWQRVAKT